MQQCTVQRCWVALALVATLGQLAGCRRTKTRPDPHYAQAVALYNQLYAKQLDEAYLDPHMNDVVAELQQVSDSSMDAEPARARLDLIERERKRMTQERADREKIAKDVAAAAARPLAIDPAKILAASAPPPPAPPDPFGPGATISDINADNGACLLADQPFHEQGTGKAGTLYKLSTYPPCVEKLPGFVGQGVLVIDGKIYRRVPLAELGIAPAPGPGTQPVDGGAAQR